MRPAYIYALAEPNTGDVRYVGKALDPVGRYASHLKDKTETRRGRWIRSLGRQGLRPTLFILEATEGDWQEAERRWIATYRAEGADLTNHTDGGEGISGLDAEVRARIAAAAVVRMANPEVRARIFTPERAAAISRALAGKPKAPGHVANLPQNQKGYTHKPGFREKIAAALLGNQHALGLRHTDETKARIAEKLQGNQHTKGRVMPEGEKLQRSLSSRGKKSELHRERISEGLRASWANGRTWSPKARIEWPSTRMSKTDYLERR